MEFFAKPGFKFNPRFTDENATCMIVGEDIFVMLLVEKFFKTFTKKGNLLHFKKYRSDSSISRREQRKSRSDSK